MLRSVLRLRRSDRIVAGRKSSQCVQAAVANSGEARHLDSLLSTVPDFGPTVGCCRFAVLMVQQLRLHIVRGQMWFEADIMRHVRPIVGAHVQPYTAGLRTVAALQRIDELLLGRLAVMEQRAPGRTNQYC